MYDTEIILYTLDKIIIFYISYDIHDEAKFQMWFHTAFVRKFRLRLHRQLLLMAVMTFVDLLHMEHTEAWKVKDKSSGFLPKGPGSAFGRRRQ